MKRFKKMMALVIATMMIAMYAVPMSVFADPSGAQTPDTEMTVSGLEAGDVVNFYKLIKWVPGEGWKWADGVETAAADTSNGKTAITLPNLTTITGYIDTTKNPAEYVAGKISAADGGTLAQVAQRLTIADSETVASGKDLVKYAKPAYADGATDTEKEAADVAYMGLYVALVTPKDPEILYNPIFVAADYNPDSTNTNAIEVVEGTLSYSPASLAKKEKVTLTKTSGTDADVQYDVKVGDIIPFTIESVVPEFSTSYQDPQYVISDKMDTGLELQAEPAIKVMVIDSTASADDKADDSKWTLLDNGTRLDYVVSTSTNGFTVTLNSDYLKNNQAAKDIKVTYSAKVTSIEDKNVVQKNNTATVKFSNNPEDSSSYSLLEDKTNHYTFSLDANMLGEDNWENSELVKIGLSSDGTEITQSTLSNGTKAGVLEGALFGLYTDAGCNTLYTNAAATPPITGQFTSDSNGKLNISGLDAGTYYLKEIKAPAGYIKSNDTWQITIEAVYKTEPAGSYTNGDGIVVKYDAYDYLDTYKVTVKNTATDTEIQSSFQITNNAKASSQTAVKASGDKTTKLNNTKGTELPSTGGMGTTLFYIIGAILIIGAGVILVTRRRTESAE